MIRSLVVSRLRLEVGDEVSVTATVEDAETPVEELRREWTSTAGRIIGSGLRVAWLMPADDATPSTPQVTLTVRERYVTGTGENIDLREHSVSASASVLLHNSPQEVRNLVLAFLSDFSDSDLPPETVVRHFTDTCRGKREELEDVRQNRAKYVILSSRFRVSEVDLDEERRLAEVIAPCEFTARVRATGAIETGRGDCQLSALYERPSWWLCESRFKPEGSTTPTLGLR